VTVAWKRTAAPLFGRDGDGVITENGDGVVETCVFIPSFINEECLP